MVIPMADKFNSEMYPDPTAYEALLKIERLERISRFRPLVYICSPYSGDIIENSEKARKYCRFAVDNMAIPIAPHIMFPQFMDDETERDLVIFMDLVLLGRCKQVWVFGDIITDGMKLEINKAKRRYINVRYFTENCKEKCPEMN